MIKIFFEIYETFNFDISNEIFIKNILSRANLLTRYIREFETFPSNIKPSNNLLDFHQQMNCFHSNLKNALTQYRKNPTKDNFNQVLSQIRVNLDSLLSLKNDPETISALENLLNDTKTIENVSNFNHMQIRQAVRQDETPQRNIVNGFFNLIQIIFDFTSKAVHTISKKKL